MLQPQIDSTMLSTRSSRFVLTPNFQFLNVEISVNSCSTFLHFLIINECIKYAVLQKCPTFAGYNLNIHELILLIFCKIVIEKGSHEMMLYLHTSPKQCFCINLKNTKTRKWHFSLIQVCCIAALPNLTCR